MSTYREIEIKRLKAKNPKTIFEAAKLQVLEETVSVTVAEFEAYQRKRNTAH